METIQHNSYRQIFKATTIFGGVQVFNVLVALLRSKLVAILLGPAGMGLSGLLQAGVGMIAGLTNFGLYSSAVKTISAAQAEGDEQMVARIIAVFRRLIWATGLLGLIITLVFSPYLSQITFGNKQFTWAFAVLSITLLINQITAGQEVLLRATRKIKLLAKSSTLGSLLSLITSIPFYYYYGIEGIVPALISTALTSLLISGYYSSKLFIKKINVDFSIIKSEGKEMLIMGFMISLSGIITLATSYLVRIFISNYGSLDDVGLFNAGFVIVNSYVGMIFTAMGTDYFPKLSEVANDVTLSNQIINQQAEIAILILSPIILIFIFFIKWIIYLLYSEAFLPITQMVLFAAAGMLFKAFSWSIAFLFLAKGASKLFFWNELITNIYTLAINLAGYYWYGLTGLGISFLITYLLYSIQVFYVTKIYFNFNININLFKNFLINLFTIILSMIIILYISSSFWKYGLGILIILFSILYNFRLLNHRLGIRFTKLNF